VDPGKTHFHFPFFSSAGDFCIIIIVTIIAEKISKTTLSTVSAGKAILRLSLRLPPLLLRLLYRHKKGQPRAREFALWGSLFLG